MSRATIAMAASRAASATWPLASSRSCGDARLGLGLRVLRFGFGLGLGGVDLSLDALAVFVGQAVGAVARGRGSAAS